MSGFFESARDFDVASLSVDNVKGKYTTERHSRIREEEVSRETYDQEGAVGVFNGAGMFNVTINHTGSSSKPKEYPERKSLSE